MGESVSIVVYHNILCLIILGKAWHLLFIYWNPGDIAISIET